MSKLLWALCGVWACLCAQGCACEPIDGVKQEGAITTDLPEHRLLFSDDAPGERKLRSFALYNPGAATVTLRSLKLLDAHDGAFALVDPPPMPLKLVPGKSQGVTLTVAFVSSTLRSLSTRIEAQLDDAQNTDSKGRFFIEVGSQLELARLDISCGKKLDFGEVFKGRSRLKICKLRNLGAAPVTLLGLRYTPKKGAAKAFSWDSTIFPVVLDAEGRGDVSLEITYTPDDTQEPVDQGQLLLRTDLVLRKGEAPPQIELLGKTQARLLEIVPIYPGCRNDESCRWIDPRLYCEAQSQCRSSKQAAPFLKFAASTDGKTQTRQFELRSVGTLPVTLTGLTLEAKNAAYFSLPGFSGALVLKPGQRRLIHVDYRPKAPFGQRIVGGLQIASDDHEKPTSRLLLEVDPTGCRLQVSAEQLHREALDLGALPPGSSARARIELLSSGPSACTLEKLDIQGVEPSGHKALALVSPPKLPLQIEPGQRKTLEIVFDSGSKEARYLSELSIHSDDIHRPEIALSVRGETKRSPCIKVEPQSLDMGVGIVGCAPLYRNVSIVQPDLPGCKGLLLTSLKAQPEGSFEVYHALATPHPLKPGKPFTARVRFKPAKQGAAFGSLTIQTDALQVGQIVVPLSGRATVERDRYETHRQRPPGPDRRLQKLFFLEYKADPSTIQVRVDGVDIGESTTAGWRYVEAQNAIEFLGPTVPVPGVLVELRYTAKCGS